MKKKMLMALAAFGLAQSAAAQVSDNVVRIGVLNDQSGLYADLAGPGSTLAAQMAVEDFGGSVLGKPVEIVSGDHGMSPPEEKLWKRLEKEYRESVKQQSK